MTCPKLANKLLRNEKSPSLCLLLAPLGDHRKWLWPVGKALRNTQFLISSLCDVIEGTDRSQRVLKSAVLLFFLTH